jgi:PKD domain
MGHRLRLRLVPGLTSGALVLTLALGTPVLARAQDAPSTSAELRDVTHLPPSCVDTEAFPLIEARASSPDAARHLGRVVLRFRSEGDPGWHEVAFRSAAGTLFQAALPKPLPGAGRIVYYIAAGKPELRSPRYTVNVLMGGCPGARSAPQELVDGMRVRRTSSDQDEVPTGFNPDGIRTGGRATRTTLGILAGAAGGATIAAVAATGGEPSVGNPGPGNPPAALRPCFTPDPIPDIDSGDTVLFDASCTTPTTVTSYSWNFGDGTTGQGSSIEHLFRPGALRTVTLTVSDGSRTDSTSRVVHVRSTPTACFITNPDPPRILVNDAISFNADCALGDRDGGATPITLYDWDFGDGREGAEGRFVSHQFTKADLYGVTLTVTNQDGRQDKTTQFILVERRASGGRVEVAFTSELELPAGASAAISINDSETVTLTAPSPREQRVPAHGGENVVSGRVLAGGEGASPGRWRFDFRNAPNFVPGSLQVDSGQVLTLDRYGVVFQLTSDPRSGVRFRFRLEE